MNYKKLLLFSISFFFLAFAFAQFVDFGSSQPEEIISQEGQFIYITNVLLNNKSIDYIDDNKEIIKIIPYGLTNLIVFEDKIGWTIQHQTVYEKIKLIEEDLLNTKFPEIKNPTPLDCQLNPKLPKCP